MKPIAEIVADFDAIAVALGAAPPRDRLTPAERALVARIPGDARLAADVGCGDGTLARALARRGLRVLAVDVAPEMIALARARTPPALGVDYRVMDVMAEPLPAGAFHVVVSVNVVHHFPLELIVPRLAQAVAPGGTLVIQDVVTRPGVRYAVTNVVAALRRRARGLLESRRGSRAVARLYERHGREETYLTPDGAAAAYGRQLPGARVEHELEWRYTVTWRRPARA